jgi:hypothetical protein
VRLRADIESPRIRVFEKLRIVDVTNYIIIACVRTYLKLDAEKCYLGLNQALKRHRVLGQLRLIRGS